MRLNIMYAGRKRVIILSKMNREFFKAKFGGPGS